MNNCNFNPNTCPIDCKKYLLCSYFSIQNQISNVQSQLNFIYNTLGDILKSNEKADLKINLVESALHKFLLESPDSEKTEYL